MRTSILNPLLSFKQLDHLSYGPFYRTTWDSNPAASTPLLPYHIETCMEHMQRLYWNGYGHVIHDATV